MLRFKQYQLIEQSPLWVKGVVLGLIVKLNSLDSQINPQMTQTNKIN